MVTYSNAEKKIVESGADAIHKVLAGDDADAKERLLLCLDYYLAAQRKRGILRTPAGVA